MRFADHKAVTQIQAGAFKAELQRTIAEFEEYKQVQGPLFYSFCAHVNRVKGCCFLTFVES